MDNVSSSSEASSDAGLSSVGDPAELDELEAFAGPWMLKYSIGLRAQGQLV